MLEDLREEVLDANLALARHGLAALTWGNVSGIDRERGLVVIKPSGVPYDSMRGEHLAVVDLDGRVVEGSLRPSSDTATHLVLYRAFPELGGVVHTHSTWATAFAQAERDVPLLGTTHADLAPRSVPIARRLLPEEIEASYEESTGEILVEAVGSATTEEVPAVLAPGHGPFAWGTSASDALEKAVTLEEVAKMALLTLFLRPDAPLLDPAVRDKHFLRKHGPGAYYGQHRDHGIGGHAPKDASGGEAR
ncbi:MAG: araD [Acidimicrobiaceae bacterium]|nr:araD [Acidimicrobiaceae bacterium]